MTAHAVHFNKKANARLFVHLIIVFTTQMTVMLSTVQRFESLYDNGVLWIYGNTIKLLETGC
jgi:hypothetical protein